MPSSARTSRIRSGRVVLPAFANSYYLHRLDIQEQRRRNPLVPLLTCVRQFYTRSTIIKVVGLTFLFSSFIGIHAERSSAPQVIWIMLEFVKTGLACMLVLQATEDDLVAGSNRREDTCPRRGGKTKRKSKIEHEVQTCQCLNSAETYMVDEDRVTSQLMVKTGLSAGTNQQADDQDDVKRLESLNIHGNEPPKESPAQEPCHQTGSAEAVESSAFSEATPENKVTDFQQDRTISPLGQTSADSQKKQNIVYPEKSPRKFHTHKTKRRVSRSFLKKSLELFQSVQQNTDQKFQKLGEKLTALEESERKTAVNSSGAKDLIPSVLTTLFAPEIQRHVYMYRGSQNGHDEEMWNERSRLASFAMYPSVPPSGVWVTQLAAAGFYCPDKYCTVLRCAFCNLEIEINQFRNRAPSELHSMMSPSCPLVKGEARNQSFEEQRQVVSSQFIRTFIGAEGSVLHPSTGSSPQRENRHIWGSGQEKGSGAAADQSPSPSLSQLSLSGHPPEPSPQHRAMSSTHPSTEHGQRQGSGFSPMPPWTVDNNGARSATALSMAATALPQSAVSNTTDDPQLPAQPRQQVGSHTREQSPSVEPVLSVGSQSSPSTSPPLSSASSRTQSAETPPEYQTARPTETSQQRTHPGDASHRTHPGDASHRTHPGDASTGTHPGDTSHRTHPGDASHRNTAAAGSDHSPLARSANETVREVVTYAQLGIYTQEPKRPDLAIASSRVNTYANWPHPSTHCPEDMAEAGFYYVGKEDRARCFYCRGCLKSWTRSHRPWVEHARFFPHCPFVGQVKGQEFIDVVQELKEKQEEISEAEVNEELKKRRLRTSGVQGMVSANGAVQTEELKGTEDGASAKTLRAADRANSEEKDETQLMRAADELENQNQEIKNERTCKICQVEDVSILFLPCGHLVSCSQCAPALRTCAICRQRVKGRVKVLEYEDCQEPDAESEQGEVGSSE